MQILGGDPVGIGCRDLLDFRLIFVEPVGRISVILVGHALAENLVRRVETEDERVENGVFGTLDFVVGDGLLRQIVDVFSGSLNGFDGALTLGADRHLQDAGMAEVGADASTDAVSQAALGTDVIEQARREAAAERFVENADGVIVGIVAGGTERHHVDGALVHIVFRDEVVTGLGRIVFDVVLRNVRTFRPRVESLAQPGFYGDGIKISADAENDVVGVHIFVVPVDQVLARDGGDRRVLGDAGVGIVGAIGQLDRFALRNFTDLVVAAGDAVAFFLLGDVDFFGAEFGILQNVDEGFEYVV